MTDPREALGRLVRETWVKWAAEQPDPKPSWLAGWDELDVGQREVDMRIGRAVAIYALTENAITWGTSCTSCARILDSAYAETMRREAAEAKLAAVTAELKACMAGFFAHYGNNSASSLLLARDLAEGVRQILDRDSGGTVEEPFTADAGQPSAADKVLAARATGGGIRSREVQPAFEDEDSSRG